MLPGSDFRILASCLKASIFSFKSLFKSLYLEPHPPRSRFQASGQVSPSFHLPIEMLIQKLGVGAPGAQVQIWEFWPSGSDFRILARWLRACIFLFNFVLKSSVWGAKASRSRFRDLGQMSQSIRFLQKHDDRTPKTVEP